MIIRLGNLTILALAASFALLGTASAQRPGLSPESVFIDADTDAFDPGLPIGAQFPPIRALYQGREVTDISQFMRSKGVVFLVNRSVDW